MHHGCLICTLQEKTDTSIKLPERFYLPTYTFYLVSLIQNITSLFRLYLFSCDCGKDITYFTHLIYQKARPDSFVDNEYIHYNLDTNPLRCPFKKLIRRNLIQIWPNIFDYFSLFVISTSKSYGFFHIEIYIHR